MAGQYTLTDTYHKRRSLVTPEGVDLHVKLGTGGARTGAFFLDIAIMVGSIIAFTIGMAWLENSVGGFSADDTIFIIWTLGFFFIRNFYFIFFESTRRAATPGKRALGLRVASRNGGRLTAGAVFARNVTREFEFFTPFFLIFFIGDDLEGLLVLLLFIWCGIFILFPLFNKDRLRAGDIIAGTWVIKAPKTVLLKDLVARQPKNTQLYSFTTEHTSAYGIKELHVLERVLRNPSPETLQNVALRIREKIKWERDTQETDLGFLTAYYSALRKQLEQQMLMGKRRKDKFDV